MAKMTEDIKDSTGKWLKTIRIDGAAFDTRSACLWWGLRYRCKPGGLFQKLRPTYVGCTMSKNFQDFQWFTNWYTKQTAYGLEGYDLDKDILVRGNKEYNENVCALVPHSLNCFLALRGRGRGQWPLGVSFDKHNQKFAAQISRGEGNGTIGYFATPEEAHAAYVLAKEAEAKRWAERLRNGEFIVDERVITALENWRVNAEA